MLHNFSNPVTCNLPFFYCFCHVLVDSHSVLYFQLALKHRQGRNHKMRIVVFVGSPIEDDDKEVM